MSKSWSKSSAYFCRKMVIPFEYWWNYKLRNYCRIARYVIENCPMIDFLALWIIDEELHMRIKSSTYKTRINKSDPSLILDCSIIMKMIEPWGKQKIIHLILPSYKSLFETMQRSLEPQKKWSILHKTKWSLNVYLAM